MTTEVSSPTPDEMPRRQLTAEEFIEIITLKDEEKWQEFYQFEVYQGKVIIIEYIIILDTLKLTANDYMPLPLIITNSIFNSSFIIEGGTFQNIFLIEDSKFNNQFILTEGSFQTEFIITGCTFHNKFMIAGGTFNNIFSIIASSFLHLFKISEGIFFMKSTLITCEFHKLFSITGGTFNNTFLTDRSIFKDEFILQKGIFQNQFTIIEGIFFKSFIIKGGIFQDILIIKKSKFKNSFIFENGLFYNYLLLSEESSFYHIDIVGGIFYNEVKIVSCYINEITINNLVNKFILYTNDLYINNFSIEGVIPKDSLFRINATLSQLSFIQVNNFGTIILTGVKPFSIMDKIKTKNFLDIEIDVSIRNELQLINSDLGKSTFISCDFSNFYLSFQSSKIIEIFITGTKMPREIINRDISQKQLGYSQIKKIFDSRGDKIEANRYFAKEMESYLSTLSWRNDFWEKLNLCANKYSTDYGQSWERGLSTTILISLFFYIPYCLLLGFYPTLPNKESLGIFGELASYFLEFLNPIRKADYIAEQLLGKETKISGWARITEGISRVVIAYCVYQLIQAFRKHGKSS